MSTGVGTLVLKLVGQLGVGAPDPGVHTKMLPRVNAGGQMPAPLDLSTIIRTVHLPGGDVLRG